MGIYARDQIQYGNLLQNALQNRARAIERQGDNLRGRGQMWGSALNTAGNTIKDAAFSIADQYHSDEQAQLQRAFQAEQADLRNQEAMERLAREQQFQALQNELNRDNTLAIAQNRFEQAQAEKKASDRNAAKSSLDIYNANIDWIDSDLSRTDDPSRTDQLKFKRAEMQAKIDKIYEDYPDLRPVKPQVQQVNSPAQPMTPPETPQEIPAETLAETPVLMQSENLTKFFTQLENSKSINDTEAALKGLNSIDRSKLDKAEKEKLQKSIEDGDAKLKSQKKAAAWKAEGWKLYKNEKSALKRGKIAKKYGLNP